MATYTVNFYQFTPGANGFTTASNSVFTYSGPATADGRATIVDNEAGIQGLTLDDDNNGGETARATASFNGNTSSDSPVDAEQAWLIRDNVTGREFSVVNFDIETGAAQGDYTLSEFPLVPGRSYTVLQYDVNPDVLAGSPVFNQENYVSGTVSGTNGDDDITYGYDGDPEGDVVSRNSDIVEAGDGNDRIAASAGDDTIFAGDGTDTVFGGGGDDVIDGGIGADVIVGDQMTNADGQDDISGGAGDDVIYGDSLAVDGTTAESTSFEWSAQGVADNDDISGGLSGLTNNGDVRVTLTIDEGTNFSQATMDTSTALFDFDDRSDTSSIELFAGITPTSSEAGIVRLDFSAGSDGYVDEVSDVSFGIFDLDEFANQFNDEVIIRAYDANGNLVPVTLTTSGQAATPQITTTVDANGVATASVREGAGGTSQNAEQSHVQVNVAGPVAQIEIQYRNADAANGQQAINIGDITLTSIPATADGGAADTIAGDAGDDVIFGQGGDDVIDGGTDDDTIDGGVGDDSIVGGTGDDTIILSENFDTDTIDGSADAGDGDVDVLDASGLTTDMAVNLSAPETGVLTTDGNTANFEEIEEIRLGSGDDSATGSTGDDVIDLGEGTDTIDAGAGDDEIELGRDPDGTPDGDADLVVFSDGDGNDTITGFDAPTPAANGRFDGIDTLDVSDLFDRPAGDPTREPVNTNDVTVTPNASGDAVLTFPNGETLTLVGIPAADADNPFYLNAIGIPLPDGTVSGDNTGNLIDGSYLGDPDGDIVDNNDAILPGDTGNDDLIEGNGGADTIFAGDGADEVYGGTGSDTIDGGVGDDTLFGNDGSDIFTIAEADGTDTIDGSENSGNGETDTVDFSGVGTTDGVDISFTGDEAASYQVGTTGSDGTFTNIERVVGSDNDDTVDLTNDTSGITVETGAGTDTVTSGQGDDDIDTGTGDDTILLDENAGTDTIAGGEDSGNGDVDTVDFSDVATTDGATVTFTGDEAATYSAGTGTDGTFTEIERVVGTDNADSVDLSGDSAGIAVTTGAGDDTITSGQGDDDISAGTGDDTILVDETDGTDTIVGGEDGSGTDTDTVDFSGVGGTDGVTITYDGDESADYAVGTGSDGTFDEIEALVLTDNDDVVDATSDTAGVTIDAGDGDDTVTGGQGDDSITAGTGDDTIALNDAFGDDTIAGGEDADGADTDTLDAGDVTTDITLDLSAPETGTLASGGDTVTFDEIEEFALGSGDDSATGSTGDDVIDLGEGTDTIEAGAGDDEIELGRDPDGTTDGDADLVVFSDGDGNDTITGFDAPTPAANGRFDGIDTLDVSDLFDRPAGDPTREPVNTNDVTVTPNASGDAVLTFPNGETLTLVGIPAADADNPFYLNAIGIPLPDGTVSGDNTGNLIDGSYLGDPDGDIVDNNDAILPGDTGNDDLIEGNGGNDTIFAGDGADEVYGGTGSDTIDGGVGDDTLFGDSGSDVFIIAEADDTDAIFGDEDLGDGTGETDTVDFSSVGTTDGVDVSFTGDEAATYQVGTTGSDGTFAEIERVVGTDNADLVDLSNDTSGITVETGAGTDTVTSGQGDDDIDTGTGNDTIAIDEASGTDTVVGGEDGSGTDVDTVDFSDATGGTGVTVTYDGDESAVYAIGAGSDGTFDAIEAVVGTDFDDTVDASLDTAGATITTGAGDDVITGGAGDDVISAGTGQDDILFGDDFGNDSVLGGEGLDGTGDVLDGSDLTQGVTVDFSAAETGTIDNGSDVLEFAEIEEIFTGAGDDTVVGGSGDDTVDTGAGDDQISTGEGDDIAAGSGDDTITLSPDESGDTGAITVDGCAGDETTGDTLDLAGRVPDWRVVRDAATDDGTGSFSGSVVLDDGTTLTFSEIERIICFTPGTAIATPRGARAIETLNVGDMVVTRDHGLQPIRWIQSRTVPATGNLAPVRIRPGAVVGLEKDLIVSPQHRMLFTGYRSELLFGEREVLMPAIHLVDHKMVTREEGGTITYIHMMFDSHEVVYADGAASESFHPGEDSIKGITDLARTELFDIFPELRSNVGHYGAAARRCLKRHEARMLLID